MVVFHVSTFILHLHCSAGGFIFDSAGFDQFFPEFLRMLQIVVLMLLFGSVEGAEGLDTDEYLLAGFFFQRFCSSLSGGFLAFAAVVHGKRVGMTAVDELTVGIEGINTAEEDVQQLLKGNCFWVEVDADGLPVAGALILYVGIGGVHLVATAVAAGYIQHTFHFLEGGGDAPEAAAGKISGFHRFHKLAFFLAFNFFTRTWMP